MAGKPLGAKRCRQPAERARMVSVIGIVLVDEECHLSFEKALPEAPGA